MHASGSASQVGAARIATAAADCVDGGLSLRRRVRS